MATQGPRSRWWKFYTTLIDDKRHYTDAQFRGFITLISKGEELPPYGELPKLPSLRAMVGSEVVDFLIAEGDLDVSGPRPFVMGRDVYQAPVDRTAAERQRRHRQQVDNGVDNGSHTLVTRDVRRDPLPSTSTNVDSTNEENGVSDSLDEPEAHELTDPTVDFDALDRYYELTRLRPWGKRSGSWLMELQAAHGIANVVAAIEVENAADPGGRELLSKVAARLERQADRVEQAKKREPKPVDPVQAQLREALRSTETADPAPVGPEPDPAAVAAGQAAWQALRGSLAGSKNGTSHRPSRVLASAKNDPAGNGRTLTVDSGSGGQSAAAVPSGTQIGNDSFSPSSDVAIYSRAEPGESEPGRSEASTDEATAKGNPDA